MMASTFLSSAPSPTRCISVGSKGSELPAGESYCDPSLRPQAVKECLLPCPSECVLSEWSEWTRCREVSLTC